MYFNQIKLRNGIPFTPVIPKPKSYEDYSEKEIYMLCEKSELNHYDKQTKSSSDFEKNNERKDEEWIIKLSILKNQLFKH